MSITVLMTTYNCAPYIKQAIKSVLNQTYKDFEFLIIDDGSTDNTEELVHKFNDSRIRYIKSTHIGRSAALNLGLKEAKYDLIALMDADDISHPRRIEKQLEYFDLKENKILCTWSIYFKNNKLKFNVKTPSDNLLLKNKMAIHSYICNPSVIYNKNFILSNGGYLEELSNSEDYELWLRLLNKAEFVVCKEYLLFQRLRDNSLSRKDIVKTKQQANLIYNKYKNLDEYFSINKFYQQIIVGGWREYFYGSRKKARENWSKLNLKIICFPKVILALIFTFLNDSHFNWLWEKRIRLQITFIAQRIFMPKIWKAEAYLKGFLKSDHSN